MIIQIPHPQFTARSIGWSPVGDSVVLFGKEKCTVAYFTNRENALQSQKCAKPFKSGHTELDTKLKNLNIINA